MGNKFEPLVFEILNTTGYVVMTRRKDDSGRAYQGSDGRTYRDLGVRLEFTDDGNSQIVDVHKGETCVVDLRVTRGDHNTTHPWLQTDTLLKLLPSASYDLEFSGLMATVTRK